MPAALDRLKQKPWVQHLIRAVMRYSSRLGSQFSAAITYFSVLAIVPILMFAFSIAGFVLTQVRPELLTTLATTVADAIGLTDATTRQSLLDLINTYLNSYTTIGIVGLLSALYSGAGWMGNLKSAFRVQTSPELDLQTTSGNVVVRTVLNLVQLVGLLVLIVLTFGLATLSTSLTTQVLDLLHLSHVSWLEPVLTYVPIVFSVGAGWLLFMYVFAVLPRHRARWSVVRRGALAGAIGLGVLQYAATFLIGRFSSNNAIKIFGPVIALMLFFNLFAQLILLVAAWVATADHPAETPPEPETRFALAPAGGVDQVRAEETVPVSAAEHQAEVEARTGWFSGFAAGAGLGAVVAYVVGRAGRGRSR